MPLINWSQFSVVFHVFPCFFPLVFMPSLGRCHMPLKIRQNSPGLAWPPTWHIWHGTTWNIMEHHVIFRHISNKIGELATKHLDVCLGVLALVELKWQCLAMDGNEQVQNTNLGTRAPDKMWRPYQPYHNMLLWEQDMLHVKTRSSMIFQCPRMSEDLRKAQSSRRLRAQKTTMAANRKRKVIGFPSCAM